MLLYFLAGAESENVYSLEEWQTGGVRGGRYLKHENGVPFFWLGETGWLMPQRLNRDEGFLLSE